MANKDKDMQRNRVKTMTGLYLTRSEFLALPMDKRREILRKQANNKGVLKYYQGIVKDENHSVERQSASNSCEAMYLD
jgi:hypothetical protein